MRHKYDHENEIRKNRGTNSTYNGRNRVLEVYENLEIVSSESFQYWLPSDRLSQKKKALSTQSQVINNYGHDYN